MRCLFLFNILLVLLLGQLNGLFAKYIIHEDYKYCSNRLECGKNELFINEPNGYHSVSEAIPKAVCEVCDLVVPTIQKFVAENKTEHIIPYVTFFCNEFKIESPNVCDLVIKEYADVVIAVIRDSKLDAADFCDAALGCGTSNNPLLNWNVTLPNVPKPPVIPPQPPQQGSPTVRILHLSDIHIDFEYQPGSPADCLDPLCCRNISTPNPKSNSTGAGYWGDYRNCDVPLYTVQNMFEYISNNEDFDMIYWTGDLPPHNVWNQTRNDQLSALNVLSSLFLKYFPQKVIYSTLGNHEAAPCNIFPPDYVKEDSINWLYSAVAKNWTATGLPASLIPDIEKGGFYSVLVAPGLRLISLNMNMCPSLNFWLFINTTDPLGQLAWLANLLQYSEDHGEKVHIIGHINPNGCLSTWSSNYYTIINRYENTVTGQFFGHTHNDEFELFYDLKNVSRSTNIAYLAPSVTTQSFMNPGYRIYTADGLYTNTSWRVLDHETKFANLTESNISKKLNWTSEYTAKSTYGLNNLFPQDWSDLINYLLKNPDDPRAQLLYKYYFKSADDTPKCTDTCIVSFLCRFKQANAAITIPCYH